MSRSRSAGAPCRAPTSGSTPRPTRSRTAPSTPTAGSRPRWRLGASGWAGRSVLDLGCGTGFHLPRFAATAASVIGVEPHPDLVRWPGVVPAGCPRVRADAGPRRRCRSPTRRSTWCTPGGPTSSAPAASPASPSSTASYAAAAPRSSSTTTRRARRSAAWFRRGYPHLPAPRPSSGSGPPAAGPGSRSTSAGRSPRAPTWRASYASSSRREVADEVLAGHEGTEVDYAVNLWWRRF